MTTLALLTLLAAVIVWPVVSIWRMDHSSEG